MSMLSLFSGSTDSHSLSVKVGASMNHWCNISKRFGGNTDRITPNDMWHEFSREEQASILVHYHEQDHVAVMKSSPFGLLLWRCEQVLIIGVSWFCTQLDLAGVHKITLPLTTWYRERGGRKQMAEAIRTGKIAHELLNDFDEQRAVEKGLHKLDELCEELDEIRNLRDILSGRNLNLELTVKDFLRTANLAFSYLSERCDLGNPVRWKTRLSHSDPLFDESIIGQINGLHIIEALARFREHEMLQLMGASQEDLDDWRSSAITGIYRPVYEELNRRGLDSIAARNLCFLALIGPIDPTSVNESDNSVLLENTLPWFRLKKLLDAYQHSHLNAIALQTVKGLQEICERAGLGPPEDSFKLSLRKDLLGPNAKWQPIGNEIRFDHQESNSFFQYAQEVRMNTLREIEEHFKSKADYLGNVSILNLPPLISPMVSFTDGVYFKVLPELDGLARQVAYWWQRMIDEYCIAMVYGRPPRSPSTIGKSLISGYEQFLESNDTSAGSEKQMLLNMFSEDILKNTYIGEVGLNTLKFYD